MHLQATAELRSLRFSKNMAENERERAVPVVRNKEPEVPDVGRVLGQDNVTCELPWGKPEREVWWLVQLEFSVDPERREEPSAGILHCRGQQGKATSRYPKL